MEAALKTGRTAKTARPVTSSTGRFVRLGTVQTVTYITTTYLTGATVIQFQASMLSNPDGPFVNVSRLNFSKYAAQPALNKPLFEYLFYHENDVRNV